MIIDCISDLHGYTPELPGGDILLIGGDLTSHDVKEQYDAFLVWLKRQPYRCKIVIAGNHDGLIESGEVTIEGENIHYLCDSGIEFENIKIWGSPYTPTFMSWHFMCSRGEEMRKHWNLIPTGTDILVTHGPPYGIFDKNLLGESVGCHDLLQIVQEKVKPRIHTFGHIHEGGGHVAKIGPTTYINASYVDVNYRPRNRPIRVS